MSHRELAQKWVRFFPLWGIAGFLEFPFVQSFFLEHGFYLSQYLLICLVGHLVAASLLFFAVPKEQRWFVFCITLFLPLFGWGASAVFFLTVRPTVEAKHLLEEEVEFNPQIEQRLSFVPTKISKQERILKELDLLPLIDIMKGEDIDLKRGAIEKLAALKTPEAIDLLLSYRSDATVEVRFYVTSALTRIKKELDEELDAAKHQMQRDVNDIAAHVLLARIYLQYSRSHLLDAFTAKAYEQESLYHLNFALKTGEAEAEVYWMLIDVYSSRDEWELAFEALQLLEKRETVSPKEIALTKVEILFHTARYKELREELSFMKTKGVAQGELESLSFWWGA